MSTMSRWDTEELLTLAEVESITKRRVATLRKDLRLRKLPFVKIGRSVRIPREAVTKLIAEGWREAIAL